MAVVRCPRHNIPYNDQNPRGCPACAAEREGPDPTAEAIRELQRASRGVGRPPDIEILPPPPPDEEPRAPSSAWPPPVTQPPRFPTPLPTRGERATAFIRHRFVWLALGVAGVVALLLFYEITKPAFVPQQIPPSPSGDAKPVPLGPNIPLDGVFAMLGTAPGRVNPDSPTLARYVFSDGLTVDALNGTVYAVTVTSPAQSWRGLRVGMDSVAAEGALSLLGRIQARPTPRAAVPFSQEGFQTYPTLAGLPRRTRIAEVRPPNGCYDVIVDFAPRAIGWVSDGKQRFVAIARGNAPLSWALVRIRAVSRALPGPYAAAPICAEQQP